MAKKLIIRRKQATAQYFTEELGDGVGLDMILIPGGSFWMGTEDKEIERLVKEYDWEGYRRERPQHKVNVPTFFMGRYPKLRRIKVSYSYQYLSGFRGY